MTYNVYDHVEEMAKRGPALLKEIGDANADVIALQEITPEFLKLLVNCEWSGRYKGLTEKGEPVAQNELCILSKYPVVDIQYVELPSRLNRAVLIAKIVVNGRTLAVATTHLDSFLEDGPARAKQLDQIFPLLRRADDAVLMGDFNFGDGEQPDTAHLDAGYTDSWTALHAGEAGYTWNIEVSEMARRGSFETETSRRLDRILVRSSVWKPAASKIIGDKPVEAGKLNLFPSDHFGLVAEMKKL